MSEIPREIIKTKKPDQELQSLLGRLSSMKERLGGKARDTLSEGTYDMDEEDLETFEECEKLLDHPSTISVNVPRPGSRLGPVEMHARVFETGQVLTAEITPLDNDDQTTDYDIVAGKEAENLLNQLQMELQREFENIQAKLDAVKTKSEAVKNALEQLK
ncbi:MAG: hypothetical protein ABH846_01485 [Patescibacteria group bacterium]